MPESTSLFDCCSPLGLTPLGSSFQDAGCNNFCNAVFCSACQYACIAYKLKREETLFGGAPQAAGVCYFLLSPLGILTQTLCVCPLTCSARMAFKKVPEIASREGILETCLISCCCAACSNAQVYRELSRVRPETDKQRQHSMGAPPPLAMIGTGKRCKSTYCS